MQCSDCGYVMTAACDEWFCERCLTIRAATPEELPENRRQAAMEDCILEQLMADEAGLSEPER
jgi:hypothetical protein